MENAPQIFKALICDKRSFQLSIWWKPKDSSEFIPTRFYPISLGAKGHATPKGLYLINVKAECPDWKKPKSDWVPEEEWGELVKGCTPENPLKERWLGVTDPEEGIGIHGTDDLTSIGTKASHGCIRMTRPDVIELYDRIPLYTPIFIH